jgi:hypothetical protein
MSAGMPSRFQRNAWIIGSLASVACLIGAIAQPARFFQAYLLGFLFWGGVTLGGFALLMLYHLVGGAWGVIVRDLLRAITGIVPLLVFFFLPIIFGLRELYPWSKGAVFAADPEFSHRAAYLSNRPFLIRQGIYFLTWTLFAWVLTRKKFAAEGPASNSQVTSGWGLLFYCVAATFASIDWVLSLEPKWFSTIYGMLFITGQGLVALTVLILLLALLHPETAGELMTHPKPVHDLGNLLLAFLMLWAYLAFMQFLIVWMGNIKEEIPWYLHRSKGGWPLLAVLLLVLHFLVPFLLLLVRQTKRRVGSLAFIAAIILLMRLADYYWQIGPEFSPGRFSIHWLFFVTPIALGGIWLGLLVSKVRRLQMA